MVTSPSLFVNNQTFNHLINNITQLPWLPYNDTLRVFEIIYLTLLMVGGSCGNILVISSIIFERRVSRSGNIFIINLACADLLATGIYVPSMLANVIKRGENALGNPPVLCSIFGYGITYCCACSIQTLSVISLNRYMAIVRNRSYKRFFSKMSCVGWVIFIWAWPNVLMLPTLFGDWSGLRYDAKVMECLWDDGKSTEYNFFFMSLAIFAPLMIIAVCYFRLYRFVQQRSKDLLTVVTSESGLERSHSHSNRLFQREITLIRTLAVAVFCFVICWTPYGLVVMINPNNSNKHLKKVVGWLGVSNSAANFILYGLLSPTYRRGYKNLIKYIFSCGKDNYRRRRRNTTMNSSVLSKYRDATNMMKRQRGTSYSFSIRKQLTGNGIDEGSKEQLTPLNPDLPASSKVSFQSLNEETEMSECKKDEDDVYKTISIQSSKSGSTQFMKRLQTSLPDLNCI